MIHDLIGTQPSAVVTTDRYASYAFLDAQQRQICWAHLRRDFNRIGQRDGRAGRIGRRLHALGYVMFRLRDKDKLTGQRLARLQRGVRRALDAGAQQSGCSRTANTCANIIKLWPALGSFTTNTPGGHPNSPTHGHLKFPHPDRASMRR